MSHSGPNLVLSPRGVEVGLFNRPVALVSLPGFLTVIRPQEASVERRSSQALSYAQYVVCHKSCFSSVPVSIRILNSLCLRVGGNTLPESDMPLRSLRGGTSCEEYFAGHVHQFCTPGGVAWGQTLAAPHRLPSGFHSALRDAAWLTESEVGSYKKDSCKLNVYLQQQKNCSL